MNNILYTVYSPIIDIIQNGNNLEGLQENNNHNKDKKKEEKKDVNKLMTINNKSQIEIIKNNLYYDTL